MLGLLTAALTLQMTTAAATANSAQDPYGPGPNDPKPVVVVVNGWSPADIGAAALYAARNGGVVLLSESDHPNVETINALYVLDAYHHRSVIIGGPKAVSHEAQSEVLRFTSSGDVIRIGGTDRLHTAELAMTANSRYEAQPGGGGTWW